MTRSQSVSLFADIVIAAALCLPLLASCSGNGDPYSYVKVTGTITYEDGSLIPAKKLELWFVPESAPVGIHNPHAGKVSVDTATGGFKNVTSHTPFDGLVRGKHKVTVCGDDHSKLPPNLVAAEYYDPKKTPLEVDTDHLPFQIKVKKPAAK